MRKLFTIIVLLAFFHSSLPPVFAYTQITEFLCTLGVKYYEQGRYNDALHELNKALIIHPNYEPALKYIRMIEGEIKGPEEKLISPTRKERLGEFLDLIELEQEMIRYKRLVEPLSKAVFPEKEIFPKVLFLDESFARVLQPIEIEQGKSIVIVGKNIRRFLATQPGIVAVRRRSPDELLVTGENIGYTYLYVWDDSGRWTVEFLGVFPRPEGPTYEEMMRQEEKRARNFKLRYALDWSSIEAGRRIDDLERIDTHSWVHSIGLSGQTPYGNLDTSATVRRLKTTTDLTYASLALTDGQIGQFKGFSLVGGDYTPYFSNLSFPGSSVRGVMIASPAFDKKIEYNAFWGRESGGTFPNLYPDLYKSQHAFLNGLNLSYTPRQKQNYQFSVLHGWGRDRDDYLNSYGYDLLGSWIIDRWKLGYELAHDSETFGHIFNTNYTASKVQFSGQLRNIDKNFLNISGTGWQQGQLGGLFNLNYKPTEKLSLYNRLDVYQDRLYPAEDDNDRWNQDFDWNLNYQIDPSTNLDLNYTLQNDLGKLSQFRYQNSGFSLSKKFKFIRDIYTYAGYSHQENKNFSAPSIDYINDKVNAGLRLNLLGDLYYYVNKEINCLEARSTAEHSTPHATETGLDWSSQLGNTPFRGTLRFNYRDEEDTTSGLSFLSGEDYIEGYAELTYTKEKDKELYGSCRVRNSWADNPNVTKRIEASFNVGMRLFWDTGLRWDSVCDIEVYVFRDLSSDGLRERDEAPIEGVKIWLGKDKYQVTDLFGYCKFKGVRGRKTFLSVDMSTIPAGYLLTVPAVQEVPILHNQTTTVYFGIMSRSEISGIVFDDRNSNGKYDKDEKGIEAVILTLEDGKQAKTDSTGRYSFSNVSPDEHTINIDINTIPVYYLPKAALTKKITLFEGVTYRYNIPLKRIQDK